LPGWTFGGGAPQAPAVQIGLVALLLAALACTGEESAVTRSVSHDWQERARLAAQNAELRRQIDDSQRRLVEINDLVLRRVGVELHDGPAQLISFALLRLDGLQPERKSSPDEHTIPCDLERIRGALQEALAEIRCMAAGLTLPDLSRVLPADVLRLAARNHERRTATSVVCDIEGLPAQLPGAIKSCLYRFVQEALNNAYRHAVGCGQAVRASYRRGTLEVEVADAGPGFAPGSENVGDRLGLLGMRERVTSLGGTLEVESRPGVGTRLTARFKVADSGSQG
jgi:signal transduction histidine kinase